MRCLSNLLAFLLISKCIWAQNNPTTDGSPQIIATPSGTATVHFTFTHGRITTAERANPNDLGRSGFIIKGWEDVSVDSAGRSTFSVKLTSPRLIFLYWEDSLSHKSGTYTLFLAPGYDLHAQIDIAANQSQVSGVGSQDNQPGIKVDDLMQHFDPGDTLPDRVEILVAQNQRRLDSGYLAYVARYHPSALFKKTWLDNYQYLCAYNYYSYKENNKFAIGEAYTRNFAAWQRVQDSLFSGINLDDGRALQIAAYRLLLNAFLLRTKEYLWRQSAEHPEAFFKEWYDTTVTAGLALFQEDPENLVQEKIILHYFHNPAVMEFLYGLLLENGLTTNNPIHLSDIYNRFKQRFPHSPYIALLQSHFDVLAERQKWGLTEKMVFAPDSGLNLRTMEELISLVKGKTVLVDMWGTWCGPCREELDKNSGPLHAYFKGKPVDFVYVANNDVANPDKWKQLIAYFHLEGLHILALQNLTDNILKKVGGSGFPTYFIIHKDGTYELSKAGYPMDRKVLIKQIEDALSQ